MRCSRCANHISNVEDHKIILGNNFYEEKAIANVVCLDCYDTFFINCNECDSVHYYTSMVAVSGGKRVCPCCLKAKSYIFCRYEGIYFKESEGIRVGNNLMSPEAFAKFKFCKKCNDVVNNEIFDNNGSVCNRCYSRVVKNYSTRVERNLPFLSLKNDKKSAMRFYGVELEVQHNKDNSKEVGLYDAAVLTQKALNKFAILKKDATCGHGFEIVTAPATFEVHQVRWSNFFKKFKEKDILSSYFAEGGVLPDGREICCGMHVHVNKASLTPLQIGKILHFVYSKENKKFITDIAQRESFRHNNFDNPKTILDALGGDWVSREQKYTAINLIPEHTIEFRIFKGTLDKGKFFKNLEFVKALIDFCGLGTISIKDSGNKDAFCNYVQKYSSEYPNLYKYLVDLNYCSLKSPKPKKGKRRVAKKDIKSKNLLVKNISPVMNVSSHHVFRYFSDNRSRTTYLKQRRQEQDRRIRMVMDSRKGKQDNTNDRMKFDCRGDRFYSQVIHYFIKGELNFNNCLKIVHNNAEEIQPILACDKFDFAIDCPKEKEVFQAFFAHLNKKRNNIRYIRKPKEDIFKKEYNLGLVEGLSNEGEDRYRAIARIQEVVREVIGQPY